MNRYLDTSSVAAQFWAECDGVHVCILTHLLHKNLLHLCTRFVAPFCTKGPCLSQKPLRCLFLSEVFARRATNHRWTPASILPFFPSQRAAKQPNIAVNPSFSIHTATHSAQLKQTRLLCVCVCVVSRFLNTAASSQTGEGGCSRKL